MTAASIGHLGVIGVGEIAEAVVTGLLRPDSPWQPQAIHLSQRSRVRSDRLAQAYPLVRVEADNQTVADTADVLLLSVLPSQVADVLTGVRLRAGTVLVSALAGVDHSILEPLVGVDVEVVRAVPLPPVRVGAGTTAIFPDHPTVRTLFDALGRAVPVSDTAALDAVSAITSTMSTHVAIMSEVVGWATTSGLDEQTAERFVRGYYLGLNTGVAQSELASEELIAAHETVGGLNEQVRTTWLTSEARAGLRDALDAVYVRVHPS